MACIANHYWFSLFFQMLSRLITSHSQFSNFTNNYNLKTSNCQLHVKFGSTSFFLQNTLQDVSYLQLRFFLQCMSFHICDHRKLNVYVCNIHNQIAPNSQTLTEDQEGHSYMQKYKAPLSSETHTDT